MDRRRFLGLAGATGAAGIAGGALLGRGTASAGEAQVEASAYTGTHPGRTQLYWSVETDQQVIALSFDDGPTVDLTPQTLDILERAGVVATFFVIGRLVEQRPDVVRRALDAGHEIGNHTYDHASAAHASAEHIASSIARGGDAVEHAVGRRPAWLRPPKGHLNGAVVAQAARSREGVALWSVTRGGARVGDTDVAAVRDHLVKTVRPGSIVDLHDGVGASGFGGPASYSAKNLRRRRTELEALPDVLAAWRDAGFRLVTVSELVALESPTPA